MHTKNVLEHAKNTLTRPGQLWTQRLLRKMWTQLLKAFSWSILSMKIILPQLNQLRLTIFNNVLKEKLQDQKNEIHYIRCHVILICLVIARISIWNSRNFYQLCVISFKKKTVHFIPTADIVKIMTKEV